MAPRSIPAEVVTPEAEATSTVALTSSAEATLEPNKPESVAADLVAHSEGEVDGGPADDEPLLNEDDSPAGGSAPTVRNPSDAADEELLEESDIEHDKEDKTKDVEMEDAH